MTDELQDRMGMGCLVATILLWIFIAWLVLDMWL